MEYEEAPEHIKEKFCELFLSHIFTVMSDSPIGAQVEYVFVDSRLEPEQTFDGDCNDNLRHVLSYLPKLGNGRGYCFSISFYISFSKRKSKEDSVVVRIDDLKFLTGKEH